jgi:hypothetical protein
MWMYELWWKQVQYTRLADRQVSADLRLRNTVLNAFAVIVISFQLQRELSVTFAFTFHMRLYDFLNLNNNNNNNNVINQNTTRHVVRFQAVALNSLFGTAPKLTLGGSTRLLSNCRPIGCCISEGEAVCAWTWQQPPSSASERPALWPEHPV